MPLGAAGGISHLRWAAEGALVLRQLSSVADQRPGIVFCLLDCPEEQVEHWA